MIIMCCWFVVVYKYFLLFCFFFFSFFFFYCFFFFFSSRRRHTRFDCDWSSDVCSSDLAMPPAEALPESIRALARRHATSLRDEAWDSDVDRLASAVRRAAGLDHQTDRKSVV